MFVAGTASVARAWTANLDALLGKQIETYMKDCCSMDVNGLSPYPDLFSFVVILVLTGEHVYYQSTTITKVILCCN